MLWCGSGLNGVMVRQSLLSRGVHWGTGGLAPCFLEGDFYELRLGRIARGQTDLSNPGTSSKKNTGRVQLVEA